MELEGVGRRVGRLQISTDYGTELLLGPTNEVGRGWEELVGVGRRVGRSWKVTDLNRLWYRTTTGTILWTWKGLEEVGRSRKGLEEELEAVGRLQM